ncbi:aminotransferase class I/II-fold pyridoxal phosphate-dependent enzyme [Chromobacterium alticapitis]|uniref:Orn/Lys/Arg decarboxylases family 1 pyridoxal-P attachment site domain-containing protein n=1 Tax=Chromobacterium alticapitis TaxID=2073169 RepID=A0A2S5DJM5_9NEIS|nr:aminotransferase class I/II-fold pyridoxal phosphate-dependent enzyme [Chromobacterium alticapitis]POZ63229.1 hypothetical protein C2I19_05335 [Chromobacterium alticapitis]
MLKQVYSTPIADALLSIRETIRHSFHALPIFNGHSTQGSPLADKYCSLLGDTVLGSELTTTGKLFDSFFFPKAAIRQSEDLAAQTFGADGTVYVTTGTTTSNQIAATALYQRQGPVLMDKSCHQSIHFVLHGLGARVDYLTAEFECPVSERSAWNIESLLEQTRRAEQADAPYEMIVLTAQSYEGVIYDVPRIIGALLAAGVRTRKFLVDEAWGAANYFHPELQPLTAMNVGELRARYPELEVVCTQSSHKSLSTLRQASMIHFRGPESLRERLNVAKFRVHSTSPSYPILASLDLAQAQMAVEGRERARQALALAQAFKEKLQNGMDWSCYRVCPMPAMDGMQDYVHQDPCKVSIDIEGLGLPAAEVQAYLFREHGVYLNRITRRTVLLNFHIGVLPEAVDAMLEGLAALQRRQVGESVKQVLADRFVIPYPPGVPLLVPGDVITDEIHRKMETIRKTGIALLEI